MNTDVRHIIDKLNLTEHIEGGYFKETYRSNIMVTYESHTICDNKIHSNTNVSSQPIRPLYTLIYYLLVNDQFSAFHKVRNDEIWHFYKGSSVTIYILDESNSTLKIKLGNDFDGDNYLHYLIKGNTWFGAELNDKSSYALMGCTVSPGFDFNDFELGRKIELLQKYPQHKEIIQRLTRT